MAPVPVFSLHRYAVVTAAATFVLLLAGSLVTSMDAGLAVPDWPLSYGMLFPPLVGGILYEHGHRMIAGVVGLMILGLAAWTARVESRRWVRHLAQAAAGAVLLQALLGGLTVLLLLPPQISIAHACLGQTVFCLVVATAWATSSEWAPRVEVRTDVAVVRQPLWLALPVVFFAQVLLGAVIRHTGYAVQWHLGWGLVLGGITLLTLWASRRAPAAAGLWLPAQRLAVLVLFQVLLGLFLYGHRTVLLARTAHVGFGALILAQTVLLAWQAQRAMPAAAVQ